MGGTKPATALKTLRLSDLEPFRRWLTAEVPIHAAASLGPDHLIAGRADAVAEAEDGSIVVFDWKNDIAPKQAGSSLHSIFMRSGRSAGQSFSLAGRLSGVNQMSE